MSLTGGIWAPVEEQARYHEPFSTKVLEIALQLYPLARPKYGAVVDSFIDSYPISTTPIVRTRITTLSWVTFFGPEYVAKFGRELLAGIPGWRVEDLPDGGLLHQARPSIVVKSRMSAGNRKRRPIWQRTAYLSGSII